MGIYCWFTLTVFPKFLHTLASAVASPGFIMVINTTATDLRNVLTDYPGKQTISRY